MVAKGNWRPASWSNHGQVTGLSSMRADEDLCLVATIVMDTPQAAVALGEALVAGLQTTFPDTSATTAETDVDTQFELQTCEAAS